MQLTVLGSGTVTPSATRTAPSYWVSAGDVRLMMECGAGTLHRAACFGVPWYDVTHVAVTHFHVDHWGELPALLFALRWGIEPPRSSPLTLIGPRGLRTRLTLLSSALGDWVLAPDYPMEVIELAPGTDAPLADDVLLETHKTPHTEHSIAYAVRHGNTRLVYTGDTGSCESLADWARGCHLLLAECSLPDHRAIDVHLTPSRAGELAHAAQVRELVLTHFYPVFGDEDPAMLAARVFAGPVTAATDGDRFTVKG